MRERLSEWRETVYSAVSKSPRRVAIVGVVVLLMTAGVAGQAITQTFSEDFEDGDKDGWETGPDGQWSVVEDGADGTYSLEGQTGSVQEETAARWREGPVLDTQDDFTVRALVRPQWVDSSPQIRVGIASDDTSETGENAFVMFSIEDGSTYLATSALEDPPSNPSEKLSSSFDGQWVWMEISSDANSSTVNAKVWEYNTAEPSDPQLSRNFSGVSGTFGISLGNVDENRIINVDQVEISGSERANPNLTIETRQLYQPGATHDFTVRETRNVNGQNRTFDVTDNATVESLNTSLLTVNDNNTLTATDNPNASAVVAVRARHNESVTYQEVTVAEPTVENLQIVPGIWRFFAVFDDSTMFALLIAALLSVPAARFTSAFGGLAVAEMVIVIGWVAGYIAFGFAAVSVFVALFIGLNLAANIDYQVRQ